MTVTGPDFIALQARDVEAAAAFYEKQLGLRRPPHRRAPSYSPLPQSRSPSASRFRA